MQASFIVPTKYWEPCPNGRIRCTLCPNECRLAEGQRGACFVRQRVGDEIVLTTYGRSSGFCIDPIEKKPLNHFLPGTPVLSFGTAGCNLSCRFCQNWDISKSRQMDRMTDDASPEQIASAALEYGCSGVAFTYNDPVIFLEYAVDIAQACHDVGIRTVAVTAGYIHEAPRREFFAQMDAANIDLKAFTNRFYEHICGARLETVQETLQQVVHEMDTWVEITTLLIPGENDSDAELQEMTAWIREALGPDVPLHFTAFHPDYKMTSQPPTPSATLSRARRIAIENGLRYVYTGNVHDEAGGSTYCHGCGMKLIGRDWYVLTEWALTAEGNCPRCGTRCAGVFSGPPGDWGARRQPIRLHSGRTMA